MESGQEAAGPAAGATERRSRYVSPLREERAADTRRRISTAALELFAARGFAGTTVAGIAERAGVSVQTVYATFGSKAALVRALLAQLEADSDAIGWQARIAAETDPRRKLEAFARWSATFFSSTKEIIRAAQGAAGHPAIAELKEQGDRHRREGLQVVVSALAQAGALRPELTEKQAVDRAWLLTGVELYVNATVGCGWSDADYENWLAAALQEQLLARPAPIGSDNGG